MTDADSPGVPAERRASRDPEARELLGRRLQRLMVIRILVVTALFVLALVVEGQGRVAAQAATTVYPLIIAAYAFSALYALVARRVPSLVVFTYLQFAVDALVIGLVILFTGAEASPFTLLFVVNILGAGYLLHVPGGLVVATIDTVVYSVCLTLAWTGVAPQFDLQGHLVPAPWDASSLEALSTYTTVAFHFASFYLLAVLSGSLANKQAETGRALARTEDSLLRLRDMHGRIVQNIDVGLVTIDREGRVTSFNRAAEEITQHAATDVLGQPIRDVLSGVERRISGALDESGLPIHGHTFERWATRRDGRRVYLRTSLSALRNTAGAVEGYILVFEDRTRLLLMEEQLQRDERLAAVGRLSAAIAHEIRNPLASITGSVQMLRAEAALQDDDAELLGLVEREAERLNELVTDFLSLAREEKPRLQPGRIGPLLAETGALLARRGFGNLELVLKLEDDPELLLDGNRMRQVFWNLINNAGQAMAGGGRVTVLCRSVTPEELGVVATGGGDSGYWEHNELAAAREAGGLGDVGALRITVSDEGDGIPDERLARIFDPFYTTRAGGTGLGLAIVQRIVQSHGGVISVRSRVGHGTTFSIWLPVRTHDDLLTGEMPALEMEAAGRLATSPGGER